MIVVRGGRGGGRRSLERAAQTSLFIPHSITS